MTADERVTETARLHSTASTLLDEIHDLVLIAQDALETVDGRSMPVLTRTIRERCDRFDQVLTQIDRITSQRDDPPAPPRPRLVATAPVHSPARRRR